MWFWDISAKSCYAKFQFRSVYHHGRTSSDGLKDKCWESLFVCLCFITLLGRAPTPSLLVAFVPVFPNGPTPTFPRITPPECPRILMMAFFVRPAFPPRPFVAFSPFNELFIFVIFYLVHLPFPHSFLHMSTALKFVDGNVI